MVDTRFHATSGPQPLSALLGASGDLVEMPRGAGSLIIENADELATAGPSSIALAASRDYVDQLRTTSAGAVLVTKALRDEVPPGAVAIVADKPFDLFADLLDRLYPNDTLGGVGAVNGHGSEPFLEEGVVIGLHAVIGQNVEIGRNTTIGANTVVGNGVTIGRNAIIEDNCSIVCAHIGNNVVVHAGARIGCEGFGWLDHGRSNRKIPQLGRVIVQDDVEIGANTTIDRGALGDTVVGQGTKIDNLVQIGHNCRIGRYCLIAAQTGLSGSTVLEDGVLMGGGAGTGGHLTIGAGSIVRGRAAVARDLPAGSDVAGMPAQDKRDWWREIVTLRRLTKRDAK